MSTKLIPTDGGHEIGCGKKRQNVVCVVFDRCSLEILATASTHNEASQISTEMYNDTGQDVVSDEIRYDYESLEASKLVGMKLNQFQWFVDENPNHPLCGEYTRSNESNKVKGM
jgi:hypothetical protein